MKTQQSLKHKNQQLYRLLDSLERKSQNGFNNKENKTET